MGVHRKQVAHTNLASVIRKELGCCDTMTRLSRAAAALPRAMLASRVSQPARLMHTSRVLQAAHSGGGSSSAAEDEEYYPSEGFTAPIWRNTVLFLVASFGLYRFSSIHADPHPARSSSSGLSAPGNESEDDGHGADSEEGEDKRPFLTRYLDYYSTPSSVWKERNERHLELVREKAEEKLLLQDAERPPVHRLRYASTFEQASPHRLGVGSQIDLSDLNVKQEHFKKATDGEEDE